MELRGHECAIYRNRYHHRGVGPQAVWFRKRATDNHSEIEAIVGAFDPNERLARKSLQAIPGEQYRNSAVIAGGHIKHCACDASFVFFRLFERSSGLGDLFVHSQHHFLWDCGDALTLRLVLGTHWFHRVTAEFVALSDIGVAHQLLHKPFASN